MCPLDCPHDGSLARANFNSDRRRWKMATHTENTERPPELLTGGDQILQIFHGAAIGLSYEALANPTPVIDQSVTGHMRTEQADSCFFNFVAVRRTMKFVQLLDAGLLVLLDVLRRLIGEKLLSRK